MTTPGNNKRQGFPEIIRQDGLALLIILAAVAAGIFLYPSLPDRVPAHWNIAGEVDRYTSRFWGAFSLPLTTLGIYVLMTFLPKLDPRHNNYKKFQGSYQVIKLSLVLFMTWVYAVTLLNTFGFDLPVDRAVTTAVGFLFMLLGNFMGQIKPNYFVGIKTPWTLASDDVWEKTHRFSSPVWIIAGVVMAAAGLFMSGSHGFAVFIAAASAAAIISIIYSYVIYKRQV